MKKIIILITITIIVLSFTSCIMLPSTETITGEAGNHIYHKGDNIEIIDIETNDCIATLCINDYKLLINDQFTIQKYNGKDEYENDIYEYSTYNKLFQITYTFENSPGYSKTISSSNFKAYDTAGNSLEINPHLKDIVIDIDYSNSITIASVSADSAVKLDFTYDKYQYRHTAKIELGKNDLDTSHIISFDGDIVNSPSNNDDKFGGQISSPASQQDNGSSKNDTDSRSEIRTSSDKSSSEPPESDTGGQYSVNPNESLSDNTGLNKNSVYIAAIAILSVIVVLLSVLLILSYINRRNRL